MPAARPPWVTGRVDDVLGAAERGHRIGRLSIGERRPKSPMPQITNTRETISLGRRSTRRLESARERASASMITLTPVEPMKSSPDRSSTIDVASVASTRNSSASSFGLVATSNSPDGVIVCVPARRSERSVKGRSFRRSSARDPEEGRSAMSARRCGRWSRRPSQVRCAPRVRSGARRPRCERRALMTDPTASMPCAPVVWPRERGTQRPASTGTCDMGTGVRLPGERALCPIRLIYGASSTETLTGMPTGTLGRCR